MLKWSTSMTKKWATIKALTVFCSFSFTFQFFKTKLKSCNWNGIERRKLRERNYYSKILKVISFLNLIKVMDYYFNKNFNFHKTVLFDNYEVLFS